MNLKDKWIAALLSGNYIKCKTSAKLYDHGKWSAKGVLCNISNVPKRVIRDLDDVVEMYFGIDQEEFYLPKELYAHPELVGIPLKDIDYNLSFKEIAQCLIDNNY